MNLLDRILPWRRTVIRQRAEAVAAVLTRVEPTEEEMNARIEATLEELHRGAIWQSIRDEEWETRL
jgi:hypothetical protein